jgi:hypothetical protein
VADILSRVPDPKEEAIPLHGAHHEQVSIALARFKEQEAGELLGTQTVEHTPSPNERRALTYWMPFWLCRSSAKKSGN